MIDHDLATALLAIHQERTLLSDAPAVREELLRIPLRGLPQRHGGWPPLGGRSLRAGLMVARYTTATVVAALLGGFLLVGTLTQRQIDEPLPGAVASVPASPSATSEPSGTPTHRPDGTTTSTDLLPGVDLVTEEVEPGVHRVVSDGVRDLVRLADRKASYLGGILEGSAVAGLDGTIWWFDRDGFFRLGEQATHPWPERVSVVHPVQFDIEVGPDGTLWLPIRFGEGRGDDRDRPRIWSYDGQAWSQRWRGSSGDVQSLGVEVQQDGRVSSAWFTDKGPRYDDAGPVRAARLGEEGWEVLPGRLEASGRAGSFIAAEAGGTDVWVVDGYPGRLSRHDGERWVAQETPDIGGVMRAAVGSDGTLWVRLHPDCGPGSGCHGPSNVLARLDGSDWEVYGSSDGIPMMGDHYQGFRGFFAVGPDRSIWFNPRADDRRTDTECDGIANFDGEAVASFLRDMCVYAMDIAPDGTVWLQAGEYRLRRSPGPIHMYAVTPGAVAASGSSR